MCSSEAMQKILYLENINRKETLNFRKVNKKRKLNKKYFYQKEEVTYIEDLHGSVSLFPSK